MFIVIQRNLIVKTHILPFVWDKLSMTFDSSKRPWGHTHIHHFPHDTILSLWETDIRCVKSMNIEPHDPWLHSIKPNLQCVSTVKTDAAEGDAHVCRLVPGQLVSQESEGSWLPLSCSRSTLSGQDVFTLWEAVYSSTAKQPNIRPILFVYLFYYFISITQACKEIQQHHVFTWVKLIKLCDWCWSFLPTIKLFIFLLYEWCSHVIILTNYNFTSNWHISYYLPSKMWLKSLHLIITFYPFWVIYVSRLPFCLPIYVFTDSFCSFFFLNQKRENSLLTSPATWCWGKSIALAFIAVIYCKTALQYAAMLSRPMPLFKVLTEISLYELFQHNNTLLVLL